MFSRGSAPAVGSSTIASIFTGSGASSSSMRSILSVNWVRLNTCTVAMTSGSRSPSTFSGVRDVHERGVAAHDLAAVRLPEARDVLVVERRDRAQRLARPGCAAGQVAADGLAGRAEEVADRVERLRLAGQQPLDVRGADVDADRDRPEVEIESQGLRVGRTRQPDRHRQRRERRCRPTPIPHAAPRESPMPTVERDRILEARSRGKIFLCNASHGGDALAPPGAPSRGGST